MTADRSQPQSPQEGETAVVVDAPTVAEAPPQEDPFRAFVGRVEARLRVPNGFLFGLLGERSDWAFCVQLHAVLESAINVALHRAIREPRLDKEIASLSIKTKLKMAQAIEVIDGEFVGIVDSLGTLRNRIAHQAANIPGFDLQTFFATLDNSVRARLTGPEPFQTAELRMRIFVRALGVLMKIDLGHAEMEQRFNEEFQVALALHNDVLSDAIAGLLNAAADDHAQPDAPPEPRVAN